MNGATNTNYMSNTHADSETAAATKLNQVIKLSEQNF